ncbi:TPA: hypothetical protein ACPHT2_005444 [Vibrio antiquarius]
MNKIIKALERRLNIKVLKEIGSGLQGVAYETDDGRVLKITNSFSEALNSKHLMNERSQHTVEFYDVGKLINDKYYILQEKVETGIAQQLFEDLMEYAEDKFNYDFDSMLGCETKSDIDLSEEHAIFFESIQMALRDLASKGIYSFDLTEGNVGRTTDGRYVVFDIETEDYEPTLEDIAYMNRNQNTDRDRDCSHSPGF